MDCFVFGFRLFRATSVFLPSSSLVFPGTSLHHTPDQVMIRCASNGLHPTPLITQLRASFDLSKVLGPYVRGDRIIPPPKEYRFLRVLLLPTRSL